MSKGTQDTLTRKKSRKNSKVNKKNINKKEVQVKETKDNKFNFDEEIVIGLRRIDDTPKNASNKKKNASNKKQDNANRNKKQNNKKIKKTEDIIKSKNVENYEIKNKTKDKIKTKKILTKKQEKAKKRRKVIFKFIKIFTLIGIIVGGIIYAMLSPIFNIANIEVLGNEKISSQTIISLSQLNIDENIFSFRTSNVINNIKQNAYIDSVEISRKFPDKITINIKERIATYMITFGNAYVYINNQGYILEITSKKGNYPLLIGYETPEEEIQEGNRLCIEDLEKLGDVLKIMEAASSLESSIKKLITEINISDSSNYILRLEEEKKRVYLGDISNLSTKILWIKQFLESEKDNEGVIYLNVNLNTERPYFREKV